MWVQVLLGLLAGFLVAFLAYKLNALTKSGFWAAAVLGAIIFGLAGWGWAIVLLSFFISASLLSKLFKRQKIKAEEKFSKGSQRDAAQVLANGGVAGIFALIFFLVKTFLPEADGRGLLWLGFAASLAAANADTWATELGVLNRRRPVLIISGKPVEAGTSGGISLLGLAAAAGGAALVAAAAVLVAQWQSSGAAATSGWHFLIILLAGLAGSLVDSLLGATLQAIYHCPRCNKETEKHPQHHCGTKMLLVKGLAWLNNDWVNAACTLSAALLAVLSLLLFA